MEPLRKPAADLLAELREDPWFSYPDAVDLLSALDPSEVPALAAALTDSSKKLRATVARALGAYSTPAARAAVQGALADPEPDVRRAALGALSDDPDPAVIPALALVIREDPDPYTRMAALQVLGGRADPAAAAALIDLLAAPGPTDPQMLAEAATALAEFGSARALAPLLGLLDHPAAVVREHTVGALRALGNPAAVGPLRACAAREADAYLAGLARAAAQALES